MASFVGGDEPSANLASISYDGTFSFVDVDGNSLSYANVSSILTTGEGGLLVLTSGAPENMTISSAVDNLYVFNESGGQTNIMARLNAEDIYIINTDGNALVDNAPINSWITNDALDVLNVGNVTLSGVRGISSLTAASITDSLIAVANATLDSSARLNGNEIAGAESRSAQAARHHSSVRKPISPRSITTAVSTSSTRAATRSRMKTPLSSFRPQKAAEFRCRMPRLPQSRSPLPKTA